MVNVTLIGEKLAKKGLEFIYNGPLTECQNCKIKNVCFNLETGKRYKITKVRDIFHDCKIHEGRVRAVEYELANRIQFVLEPKYALEGAVIQSKLINCNNFECAKYHTHCRPLGIKQGWKLKIVALGDEFKCPLTTKKLRIVYVEYS